jgi:hypothetical protein
VGVHQEDVRREQAEVYAALFPVWVVLSVVLSVVALVVASWVQWLGASEDLLVEVVVPALVVSGVAEGSILTGMLIDLSRRSLTQN